jgi:hypothetical protein
MKNEQVQRDQNTNYEMIEKLLGDVTSVFKRFSTIV